MPVRENLHPRVQYVYQSGTQQYVINFSYIDRWFVKVKVNEQELTYNIHYSVPEFDAESMIAGELRITLNITPDSDLGDGITIHDGDTITVYRSTSFDQLKNFPQNSKYSSQKVTEALDKLTYQQQEQEDKLSRCLQLPANSPLNLNLTLPLPEPNTVLAWNDDGSGIVNDKTSAQKWAEYMDGPVEGTGFSAKWHANEARNIAEGYIEQGEEIVARATAQAEIAEAYAERAIFGLQWTAFTVQNWTVAADGVHYQLTLNDLPIVVAVYRGTWSNKELVTGVNILSVNTGCKLISLDAFNGYILSCASMISNYVHEQDIASDEWVINHNLGYIPQITVLDSNNEEPVCGKKHNSLNQCVITFAEPKIGKAILR